MTATRRLAARRAGVAAGASSTNVGVVFLQPLLNSRVPRRARKRRRARRRSRSRTAGGAVEGGPSWGRRASEETYGDTFAKLLREHAARARRPSGLPPQGPRHLADLDLGARSTTRRARSRRVSPRSASQRRQDRHRRREPPAALLDDHRGADARRRSGAGLRRRGRRRDRLCARPCRSLG